MKVSDGFHCARVTLSLNQQFNDKALFPLYNHLRNKGGVIDI